MKNILPKRFQLKITLAIIFCMLLIVGLSDILIYRFSYQAQFNGIRTRLMLIAQTTALLVNPEILQEISLNRDAVESLPYKITADKLRKVKEANPQIKYIYTMTKTQEEGIWQFLVDPDPVSEKKKVNAHTSFPGDKYDASRFPEMLKSFEGPSADTKLEIDEWGVSLSGYAPIRDKEGKAIAILGIDISANDIYQMHAQVQERAILVLLFGIILSIVVGMMISGRVAKPVEELIKGTRHISDGDLEYQVEIKGEDEISDLAKSFNHMANNLYQSKQKILNHFYDVVQLLVRILEVRDHYTKGHSESVAEYAAKIAAKMGFSQSVVEVFKRMTLLHDIGKLGIKDAVLHKTEKLTDEEWETIKKHPVIGEEILKPILGDEDMLAIIRGHHERFDGTGYPDRLKAEQINIFASIVCVADAYDAMTSNRSYRKALSQEEAIERLKKASASQFNPQVVEVFLQILEEEKL